MKPIKEMNLKELKGDFLAYDQLINEIACYGTKDVMYLDALESELNRRGYEIRKNALIVKVRN